MRKPVQQVIDGRGDQGRAEPGRAQRALGADDRGDLLDGQLGAGERVSPAAVDWMSQKAGATQSSAGSIASAVGRSSRIGRLGRSSSIQRTSRSMPRVTSSGIAGPTISA